jgi:Prealbumin-like fold domain
VSRPTCGSITIIKHTLNGSGTRSGVDQNFGYTTTGGLAPSTFTLNDKAGATGDVTCPVNSGTCNTQTYMNQPAGTYTVTETLPVTNFAFTDLSCVASGSGTSATPSSGNATPTATITLGFGGAVTCTYTNQQQLGAIKITKTSSKAAHTPLSGAKFSISSGGTPIAGSPFTTDANGVICVDHLPFGTYSVEETSAPTGYDIDDTSAHDVMVNTASTCGDGHEATFVSGVSVAEAASGYLHLHVGDRSVRGENTR